MSDSRRPLIALLAAAFVLSVLYALLTPPWLGPDEPRHVEYAMLLADKGRLVTWGDQTAQIEGRIIASMDRERFWRFGLVSPEVFKPGVIPSRFDDIWAQGLTHELHQPPLYYLLLSPIAALGRDLDAGLLDRLMRFISVLLATGTVALTWLTAREVFPDDTVIIWGSTALVALLPMHAFLGGVVNNDVLAEALAALAVLALARGLTRGFSWPLTLVLALACAGCVLAKRSAIIVLPLVALVGLLWLARRISAPAARLAGAGLLGALALGLTSSRLLDGLAAHAETLPGPLRSLVYVYLLFVLRPTEDHAFSVQPADFVTEDAFAYYSRAATTLFQTFWARFGWANVPLAWYWYVPLALLSLLALAGALVVVWRALRGHEPAAPGRRQAVILLAATVFFAVTLLLVKVVREWDSVPRAAPQARTLFPALSAIAILFVAGLRRALPAALQRFIVPGIVAGLAFLNALSLTVYIALLYYGG